MEASSRPAAPAGAPAIVTPSDLEVHPKGRSTWVARGGALDTEAITLGEAALVGTVLLVGVTAIAALAAAHLHRYGLGATALGGLVGLAVLAAAARVAGRPPRVVLDLPGLAILVAAGALALFMFLPGYHYAAGDRDPGGYMMTGAAIAHTGSVQFTDPVLAAGLPVQLQSPGARFRGIWITDASAGLITPQFYHLWPALLAVADSLHGFAGEANVDPLVGVLGVLLLVALARRVGGLVAAGGTGVLMSTHMMQVWQAKYPTAEVFTQALYVGAVLALVVALQTRWRWPSFVAGALVGAGWLARPDGVLVVLLAVGVGALLYVLRRFDARGGWFALGLLPVGAYGAYQAYGPARAYTVGNGVPALPVILAAVLVCVLGAVAARPVADRLAARIFGRRTELVPVSRSWRRRIGLAILLGYAFLFCLAMVRPLFGADYVAYQGRPIRSYDERSIYWLSWFFTWPGLLLILVGIAAVVLDRWTPAPWVLVLPTLVLLPLYMYHAKNSPFLMWWARRYVSTALPGMVVLIALGLAAVFHYGRRFRSRPARLSTGAAAGLLALFLVANYLHQSLPLRHHDEWGGSYFVGRDIAALSGGRQGVYLWQGDQYCCAAAPTLFAGPLWLEQDQLSVLIPATPAAVPGYVTAYVRHFAGQPVFLVYERGAPPPLPGLAVTVAREFSGTLPRWGESSITRPASAVTIPYHFTVYRVTAS
jgi:hypothetical protein